MAGGKPAKIVPWKPNTENQNENKRNTKKKTSRSEEVPEARHARREERLSEKGSGADALALMAEERRDKRRNAAGSRK